MAGEIVNRVQAFSQRLLRGVVSVGALLLLLAPALRAAQNGLSQYDVEAAYLYNFGKFVRWPAQPGPMQICIAGPDSFGGTLPGMVRGEKIDGHALTVRHVTLPIDAASCSLLFINLPGPARRQMLDAVKGKPVLTVGDAADFLNSGGIIQFVMIDDRVRFAVNLDSANRNHLALSSELLKVAVHVTGQPKGAR